MPQLRRLVPSDFTTRHMTSNIEILADEQDVINEEVGENLSFVARSSVMRKLRVQAGVLAKVDAPILIVGESGTGKETVARLIHNRSSRAANKFVKLSCAALEPDLLERQLFGNANGGCSDGIARDVSPLATCENGTLLLEDIDEMPLRTQAKLACLLQEKQFFSGGDKSVGIDVRVLATTKINGVVLSEKKMRKDLYYSVSAFTIFVPPLRQRPDEIPILLDYFMNRFATQYGLPVRYFSHELLMAAQSYSWPGNLRELEKFVKSYLVSGEDESLWRGGDVHRKQGKWASQERGRKDIDPLETVSAMPASKSLLHSVREEAERNAITTALEQTRWNRTAAARVLHVSYRTLLYKIQQYELSPRKH